MNESPNYYAIIPADVRYDKSLSANAKLLYGEITSLCNKEGYCWATNSYFAELYGVTTKSISLWIKQLVDKKYLKSTIIYKEGTNEILHRYLHLCNEAMEKNFHTPMEKKVKDNNTRINNKKNNKGVTSSDPVEDKKETATKEINNTKNEILPVDIINFYKKNITDENGKVKEIKSMNALYLHKEYLQEILVGLTNYSKKLPTKKEYIVSLLNFIVDKKYKDYQESKTHSIFGEWTE